MSPQDKLDEANASGSALSRALGYRLVEWERDRAVMRYAIDPAHANRHGNLHGGVVATLMDAAGGYCGCWSDEPGREVHAITLTLTVAYIANGVGGAVLVEARRTGGGKTLYFMAAEACDETGRLLATGSGTFRYVMRGG